MPRHEQCSDELLDALDQFMNTLYWLRARTGYTAAQALAEALEDSPIATDNGLADERKRDGDPADGVFALAVSTDQGSATAMLADALIRWSSAISAEHHRSMPFQLPAPPRPARSRHGGDRARTRSTTWAE